MQSLHRKHSMDTLSMDTLYGHSMDTLSMDTMDTLYGHSLWTLSMDTLSMDTLYTLSMDTLSMDTLSMDTLWTHSLWPLGTHKGFTRCHRPVLGHPNGSLLVVFGTKRETYFSEWVIRGSGKLQCEAFIGPRRTLWTLSTGSLYMGTLYTLSMDTLYTLSIHFLQTLYYLDRQVGAGEEQPHH